MTGADTGDGAGTLVNGPGAPPATAVSDRGEVLLGQPFEVLVQVRHGPAERYALADRQPAGPFTVLSGGCATQAGVLGGETRCEVRLAMLDLGTHSPVLRLDATAGAARTLEVTATSVRAIPVSDMSVPAAAIPLRGMADPVPLFVPTWEPAAWIALGTAIVVSIAVAAMRRIRARLWEAERRRSAEPRSLTPSEELEARLDELESASPQLAGAAPWFALSHAVRSYLAALSPPATLDRTTAEVLAALRAAPVSGLELSRFAGFCAVLDRAKYAGAPLDAKAWGAALAAAREVLESTRPPGWSDAAEARRA